jgi:hypothetical protein
MRPKRSKKELLEATRASVKREMAKPRMSKSARIMERYLATAEYQNREMLALGKP